MSIIQFDPYNQGLAQTFLMGEQKNIPYTVADGILGVVKEAGTALKAGAVITRVQSKMDATEDTIRSELSKLKSAGRLVNEPYGHYKLPEAQTGSDSVVEQGIPPNTAIVIRHAETNEVWISFQLKLSMTVHKPMDLVGGKGGNPIRIDAETG